MKTKQFFRMMLALTIAIFTMVQCKKDDPSIEVTDLVLDKEQITLVEGVSQTLSVTVIPKEATEKAVTWSSDNEAVATVDSNGKVTAVKPGKATITVTTKDGNKTATCVVTVKAKEVKVTDVKLDKNPISMVEGETEQLKATVSPDNATEKAVTWSSDNEAVATVDQNGKVTAVKAGKATITVTTKDGDKKATCTITVNQLKIKMTTTKTIGEKIKLWIKAEAANQAGVWIDLNNNGKKETDEEVTFNSNKDYTLKAQTVTLYGKVTYLKCTSNQLTQLDVSKNTTLKYLYCAENQLEVLDVSSNTELINLYCNINSLKTLNVRANTQLRALICDYNQLEALDVSNNTELSLLMCYSNQLEDLDVSKNEKLTCLFCSNNPDLKTINVANGNNKNFEFAWKNNIHAFDATGCPALTCIKVDKNFNPTGLTGRKEWKKDDTASYRNDGSDCP